MVVGYDMIHCVHLHRLQLRSFVRSLGSSGSLAQKIELSKKRGHLQSRIAEHQRKAKRFLKITEEEEDHTVFDFEEEDLMLDEAPTATLDTFYCPTDIECFTISLPSTIAPHLRQERSLEKETQAELLLRIGQCNDALQGVRMAVVRKAFIWTTDVRFAASKQSKTRSYDNIKSADQTLRQQAQLYRSSRKAIVALGGDTAVLSKYKILENSQLSASKTFLNTKAKDQKHLNLEWFWKMDVAGDSKDNKVMQECKPNQFYDI